MQSANDSNIYMQSTLRLRTNGHFRCKQVGVGFEDENILSQLISKVLSSLGMELNGLYHIRSIVIAEWSVKWAVMRRTLT